MTHFSIFDASTFTYLIRLKAVNDFWFRALIQRAKHSPKKVQECITESKRFLKDFQLDTDRVNAFQICKAVNSGILTETSLSAYIDNGAWHVYRTRQINDILNGDLKFT